MGKGGCGAGAAVTGSPGLQTGQGVSQMGEEGRTLLTGRSEGRRVWKVAAEFGEGGKPVTQSQAVGLQSFS